MLKEYCLKEYCIVLDWQIKLLIFSSLSDAIVCGEALAKKHKMNININLYCADPISGCYYLSERLATCLP